MNQDKILWQEAFTKYIAGNPEYWNKLCLEYKDSHMTVAIICIFTLILTIAAAVSIIKILKNDEATKLICLIAAFISGFMILAIAINASSALSPNIELTRIILH